MPTCKLMTLITAERPQPRYNLLQLVLCCKRFDVLSIRVHGITRSTQPCIPPGLLNRVPASAGGKGGNVTSAGWQATLCDPIWHVSSRSGVATLQTAIHLLLTYLLLYISRKRNNRYRDILNSGVTSHRQPRQYRGARGPKQ